MEWSVVEENGKKDHVGLGIKQDPEGVGQWEGTQRDIMILWGWQWGQCCSLVE